MDNNNLEKIILELENEGAPKEEAQELALLSKNISNLLKVERSAIVKNKFLGSVYKKGESHQIFSRHWLTLSMLAVLLLVFLGSYAVASAQKSLPGEPLYPIKKLSESVLSTINPSFKSEILKRRSEEVKDLSGNNNQTQLNNAVKSYENELNSNSEVNSQNLEESKKNLEEASKSASFENKTEIENIIRQTDNKREKIQKRDVKGDFIAPSPFRRREDDRKNQDAENNFRD